MFYYSQDAKYAVFETDVKRFTRKIYLWNISIRKELRLTNNFPGLMSKALAAEYSISWRWGKAIIGHAKHENYINVLNRYLIFSGDNLKGKYR